MIAIYPGTFDPITFGHIDLIHRSLKIFDTLIVAVAENEGKGPMFSVEERKQMILACLKDTYPQLQVKPFHNLLVDFARDEGAKVIIRGLRAVSDFEYELQMALMNKKIAAGIETFFMMPDEAFTYVSSRNIKEIASLNGPVSQFVPKLVEEAISKKLRKSAV